MPVEIRELVIRATVDNANANGQQTGATHQQGNETPEEALIKACVDRILEILKERNER